MATMQQVVEADGGDFSKVDLIPNNIVDEAGALDSELPYPPVLFCEVDRKSKAFFTALCRSSWLCAVPRRLNSPASR